MNRIGELRRQNGFTQNELSELLGVSTMTVSNWECGRRTPSFDTASIISRSFGVTVGYLMGYECGNVSESIQELYSLSCALTYMSAGQRLRLLAIAKAAFPSAFKEAGLL